MARKVKRLYTSFHPDNYDLELDLNPENMSFSGKVVIEGTKVGRPSSRITLHQNNLKINSALVKRVDGKGAKEIKVSRINVQKRLDEVRLHFDQPASAGKYSVEIEYTGTINSQLQGVYASRFKDKAKQKNIICTQFESHHAREAMPCIDEPEAKSVFNLTLITEPYAAVISNTNAVSSKKVDGRLITKFQPTPKMSSYLLAFVAGDLKYLEDKTKSGIQVRTYATPSNVTYTKFALECCVRTLDFYEDYFNIGYPLPKCDLIALPDFSAGAMENWGCITFREQAMLVDPKNTSLDLKQYVADVVAHELTHQWFGNLVTMRWWNDLWLNESFATWMSYLALEHLFPEWQTWTQFIVDVQGLGLKLDSLEHTHPIEVKINNPDEIRTVFDAISYEKGASVITMLHDYLGPEAFKEGLRAYLAKHAYKNTVTTDLWQALEQASNKPVAQFMSRWTLTAGYPLVKADFNGSNLHLSQQRFYLNKQANSENSLWPIPLFSEFDYGKNDPFSHRSINLNVDFGQKSRLLNRGRRGFYRVIYDDATLSDILSADFMDSVSDVDRLGILSDAVEAAKAGYLPTLRVLKMLESYFAETSAVVWDVMAGCLASTKVVMNDEELRENMKPFIRELVSGEYQRLGFNKKKSDSHFDRLLRPTILGLAASADESSVLLEAKRLFYDKDISIDPDIRGVAYTTVARKGKASDFDTLLKMHNDTDSSEERLKLAAALTSFKQPTLIKRSLDLIHSDNVRTQDVAYWISYSFSNHYARDLTWKWFKKNWDWLEESLGQDLSFYRMPLYVARCYSSLEFLKEFEEFFENRLGPAFERPYKQAVETITWQADWKKRDLKAVKRYFSNWTKA